MSHRAVGLPWLGRWREHVGQSVGLIRRFWPSIAPQRGRLILAVAATIGYVAMGLLEPWPLKLIFDYVLVGKDPGGWLGAPFPPIAEDPYPTLMAIVLAFLAIAAARAGFDYVRERLTAVAGQGIVSDLRRRLFAHLQALSMTFHDRRQTGELLTRLTGDIGLLRELVVQALLTLLASTLILVGMIGVMLWLDWRLTLIALVTAPALLLLSTFYMGRIKQAVRSQRRKEGKLASAMHESLSLIKVVQVFHRGAYERKRFEQSNEKSLTEGVRASQLEASYARATDLTLAAGTAAVLLVGVTRVLHGALTPGDLIVFTSYLRQMYRPLRDLSRLTERLSKIGACGERIADLLETEPDVQEHVGARGLSRAQGRVTFEEVWFAYPDGPSTLRGVSFDLEPGQSVALVGTTGAGKSTILNLIPRLYDVTGGAVRIDGHDVRDLTLAGVRQQISIVLQDSVLFSASLRENIAYGKLTATDAEIETAARAAGIHDFIASLPGGYDTVVGERGATLSGGQRQRIAIARAMVRNAPILLLDEPTTGLDARTEEQVMAALRSLMVGRTTIIVTHQLPLIREADQILFIEHGRLVERGTHTELLRLNGRYRRLFDLQVLNGSPDVDAPFRPGRIATRPA